MNRYEEILRTLRLFYVPENFKTPDRCLSAVKEFGEDLQHVPKKLKTPELCLAAITQDPKAVKWSPWSVLELLSRQE